MEKKMKFDINKVYWEKNGYELPLGKQGIW